MDKHIVDGIFVGPDFRTNVWLAEKAQKTLKKFIKRRKALGFVEKIEHYATVGFWEYEGDGQPIRHEWDGVYRIGRFSGLLRLVGFYEEDDKTRFIAIDVFEKSGRQLTMSERKRIDEVARVKSEELWERRKR